MPDFAVTVHGHALAPLYLDGDTLFCCAADAVEDGHAAVIQMDGCCTVKLVDMYPDHLMLYSPNPDYPPMLRKRSDVRIVGRPIGFFRMFE